MAFNWYILHTLSGSEKKVKNAILEQASKNNMLDYFQDIIIPSVEVPEVKKGKKIISEKKIIPGYILIKMDMNENSWHLVKKVPKVGGFLGSALMPRPVSEAEIKKLMNSVESGFAKFDKISYEIGQVVKVIDGPFESFTGVVEELDLEKSRMRVSVTIFGRETPLDLEFNQVEKI